MYLCFEDDEKRMAFPEHSLVNFDENGFTMKALAGQRDMVFVKLAAYQGCVQDFTQALTWIKKKPKAVEAPGLEIVNSAGESVNQSGARPQPAQPRPTAPPKLPEAPSF